ncbi:exo-alpha-sialidase [Pseudomonas fluorescens]|uniref:Exo-alpha-sialidase n=1 Tax=Pseudomonas fluorescens TaxID=294 RepID=A0A944DL11_PSEFL|nr:exo-alpha-sialidase [Pseudomonas fluorescens]MBT2294178.1 exo-alpha-sialidase [Pseudomonas fluorescens]MBT2307165.1 exo-alpha-sialidase [Pseudomonas fluorescens]MBT2315844.1 exo-alpha-sialidase [Pseudomonas fluorescens]MBT2331787.1 exo-alpha-sialidase [Pseudomonas fluorescens]MBT2345788.1 exo-alpha-sialidase [Pseudomonas fluorescens]
MSLRAILSRLMLCLCGLFAASSAYAESVIIATSRPDEGIVVDVFDSPDAVNGIPSSSGMVPFPSIGLATPAVQSFKGKVYMFWANDSDSAIYFSTSAQGSNWSPPQPIPVSDIVGNVSVTVFQQKLVLTFTDENHINSISSEDGIAWSNVNPIAVSRDAATNSPVVYNGKLFVLYSEEDDHTINYVTSDDGVLWSKENPGFSANALRVLSLVPVVYNGELLVYYSYDLNNFAVRSYDRGGHWGDEQRLSGIAKSELFLNRATITGNRIFISSGPTTFGSNDGVNWSPYYSRLFSDSLTGPSGLGVSYVITTNDLTADNPQLPADLATGLSHTDYATFAWRSFFALNNTAKAPLPANRGVGNPDSSFADSGKVPKSSSPLLWQTFAHRSELFPAVGFNKVGGPTRSFGSDPLYTYTKFLKNKIRMAPGTDFTLYNNLDEATQIGQNAIFFPVKPPNVAKTADARGDYAPSNDSQILFEAKANPVVYKYAQGLTSYPDHIVLPDGAVEVKAAWRKLADIPVPDRARYHSATVVTYTGTDTDPEAQNEDYALVALHIIHKTPNYPTFIFATFEHEDALTLPDGKSPTGLYYIANYNKIDYPGLDTPPSATFSDGNKTYTVSLPPEGKVVSSNPNLPVYSGSNGIPEGQAGPISVVQPLTIHSEVAAVNNQVKQLMDGSSEFDNSVWKHYRLKGVQAIPSSTQTDPDYYLANIMVESSQPGIQLFRGSNVFPIPNNNTLTNARNQPNINVPDYAHSTQSLTMGGCMGCHGIAQSSLKQGFSFLFDAINPTFSKGVTGFAGPETVGLPDPRTSKARALKYSFGPQNAAAVEAAGK